MIVEEKLKLDGKMTEKNKKIIRACCEWIEGF